MMKPTSKFPYIIFTIALVSIGIFALLFWGFIRTSIISPISDLIFLIGDFLSGFDQIYLWIFLIFGLVVITITRLGKAGEKPPANRVVHTKITSAGRLRFWETQVFLLTRTRIPSRYSLHEVRRLMVSVIGYKLHLESGEADHRLKAGELEIPPEYAVFAEMDPDPDEPEDRLTELFKLLISVLRGRRSEITLAREKNLNDLISYMEKQMEIEHDH